MEEFKVNVGDWVAFARGGTVVVGEVRYRRRNGGGSAYLLTDAGDLPQRDVLEVRAATPESLATVKEDWR
jgi:hypothetical protein